MQGGQVGPPFFVLHAILFEMARFPRGLRVAALLLGLCQAALSPAETRPDPRLSAPAGSDTDFLAAFSQASADWGSGIEAIMEDAYRKCFRTYIIAGKVMTLHLPLRKTTNARSWSETSWPCGGAARRIPWPSGTRSTSSSPPRTLARTWPRSPTSTRRSSYSICPHARGRPAVTGSPSPR